MSKMENKKDFLVVLSRKENFDVDLERLPRCIFKKTYGNVVVLAFNGSEMEITELYLHLRASDEAKFPSARQVLMQISKEGIEYWI